MKKLLALVLTALSVVLSTTESTITPVSASTISRNQSDKAHTGDDFLIVYQTICREVDSSYQEMENKLSSKTKAGKKQRDLFVLALDNGIKQLRAGFGDAAIAKADAKLDSKHWGYTPVDLAAGLKRFRGALATLEKTHYFAPNSAIGIDFDYGTYVSRICTRLAGDDIGPKPTITSANAKRYSNVRELTAAYIHAGGVCYSPNYDGSSVFCKDAKGRGIGGGDVSALYENMGIHNHISSNSDDIYGQGWNWVTINRGTLYEVQKLHLSAVANKLGGVLF